MTWLKLDYDKGITPVSVGALGWRLRAAGYRMRALSQRHSPSGTGWHVEIAVMPDVPTCAEVVALQAVCGSDLKREACNIMRARMVDTGRVAPYWRERWNVLYDD